MSSNFAYQGSDADYFAERAENSTWNAHLDRPAMLDLMGEVAGQSVLDAGCGAGHYTAALVDRGASVLGLEGSSELVARARARLGDAAEIRQHDLNTPLTFLSDASFDGAVCALVLHHLQSRPTFLAEVFRVLRPGGWFVLSTTHPTSDWQHFEDSYFSEEWVTLMMSDGEHSIRYQRMTLETIIGEVLAAGFVLERLIEPRPIQALRSVNRPAYDDLIRKPSLLALRLGRP